MVADGGVHGGMGVLDALKTASETSDVTLYECRHCGRNFDAAVEECPTCGCAAIAYYEW